jgi:hypothetical protein
VNIRGYFQCINLKKRPIIFRSILLYSIFPRLNARLRCVGSKQNVREPFTIWNEFPMPPNVFNFAETKPDVTGSPFTCPRQLVCSIRFVRHWTILASHVSPEKSTANKNNNQLQQQRLQHRRPQRVQHQLQQRLQ